MIAVEESLTDNLKISDPIFSDVDFKTILASFLVRLGVFWSHEN